MATRMVQTDSFSVDIEGLAELKDRFSAFDERAQRGILRSAAKRAAEIVVEEAKARVPVRHGNLKKSMRSRAKVSKRAVSVDIGFGPKEFYGQFVERGTSRMPAQPFLRPALDTKAEAVTAVFADELNAAITRAEVKAGRG